MTEVDTATAPCECTEPCPMAKIALPGDPGCRGAEAFPDWSPDAESSQVPPTPVPQVPLPAIKRILAIVGGVLAGVIMVGAVILAWPAEWGGQFTLAGISGGSMEPELYTDDLVVAKRSDSYQVGDVVVYEVAEGGVAGRIIHRVIREFRDGSYLTKGDNNENQDPWHVQPEWILGKQVLMIPKGSVIPSLFRSPVFLGVLTAFLVAFLLWPRGTTDEDDDASQEADAAGEGADASAKDSEDPERGTDESAPPAAEPQEPAEEQPTADAELVDGS